MSGKNQQGKMDVKQKSVLNAPLHQHAPSGLCTPQSPLALLMTTSFLDFSANQGTNLRSTPGARICADAKLWKAAVDKGIDDVPRVKLEGSHQAALEIVGVDVLKRFAAGQDNGGAERRVAKPGEDSRGIVKESSEIGGKEPRA